MIKSTKAFIRFSFSKCSSSSQELERKSNFLSVCLCLFVSVPAYLCYCVSISYTYMSFILDVDWFHSFILFFFFKDWLFTHNLQVHLIFLFKLSYWFTKSLCPYFQFSRRETDFGLASEIYTESRVQEKMFSWKKSIVKTQSEFWHRCEQLCVLKHAIHLSGLQFGDQAWRKAAQLGIKASARQDKMQDQAGTDKMVILCLGPCFELLWSFIFRILVLVTF